MPAQILSERDMDFMLYELLDVEYMTSRPRFEDHNRETFTAAMRTAQSIAENVFLPMRKKADTIAPVYNDGEVELIPEIKGAVHSVIDSGLASATTDYEKGGMQLPEVVNAAISSWLGAAGGTTLNYTAMTTANANLIEAHGSLEQVATWVEPMRRGRFAGTMAMTEPGVGSSMADLTSSAVPEEDGSYRITGNKIFISGGDHDINENIVHLVLARVKGAPVGIKGISLFIVPKFLVNSDGSIGARNDVALAGLFHKMGGRAQTTTSLNFGEHGGAVGYLVGEENQGIRYMFHMMNEARILAGMSSSILGLTSYQYSLNYAKERPQGRLLSEKNPLSPPVNIIEHPDVRRMLLAQKAYAEGSMALCLFGSKLVDDERTAETEEERAAATTLLDFLTPIIKAWPSEYCVKANHYAMQVLGGHGYIDEHPVEFFYRENRANSIYEGTTGIQSLDLIGRKVPEKGFAGYQACIAMMRSVAQECSDSNLLSEYSTQLSSSINVLEETTRSVLNATKSMNIDAAFANSVKYLDLFGHVVIAWIWLKQGVVAERALATVSDVDEENFYRGKLHAMKYFFRHELPEIQQWSKLIASLDTTNYDMQPAWF